MFDGFLTVNRRLDEWVKLEQLDLKSVETVVDEKVEDKVTLVLIHFLDTSFTLFTAGYCLLDRFQFFHPKCLSISRIFSIVKQLHAFPISGCF